MTIRKQWLIVLIGMAIIAVSINTAIINFFNEYAFNSYLDKDYQLKVEQMTFYAQEILKSNTQTNKQMIMTFSPYLEEPIHAIVLYNQSGDVVIAMDSDDNMMRSNMHKGMMNGEDPDGRGAEMDAITVYDGKVAIGQLHIERIGAIRDTLSNKALKDNFTWISLISILVVTVIATLGGVIVSKKMSRSLIETAQMAHQMEGDKELKIEYSNIEEIKMIQLSLSQLKDQLRLKQHSRKVLIDELIHQTRTPLTILKTHLEGFEDNVLDTTPEEMAICHAQIENITLYISNMSEMIDAQQEDQTVKIEKVDCGVLLTQIANGLRTQFSKKQIQLQIESQEQVVIETDRNLLSQVVYNMLTNACKFTPIHGKVSVKWHVDQALWLSIEDNGIGMDADTQVKLFNAYYRGKNATGIEGDGMGLYIAKTIMNRLEGDISVQSELEQGTIFTLRLPLKNSRA